MNALSTRVSPRRWLLLGCLLSCCFPLHLSSQVRLTAALRLMGSDFGLTAIAQDSSAATAAIAAGITEIRRIEGLISSWDPTSETSAINRAAGLSPVRVKGELFRLIQRAQKVSGLTAGAFDLSFGPLAALWPTGQTDFVWPDSGRIREVLQQVDYRLIELDAQDSTVFLVKKGMRIGFGAIGKGYAANRARQEMQRLPLLGGMVNAGGDLTCWGQDLYRDSWHIGLSDPRQPEQIHTQLEVRDLAVVTSGDYINFILHEGIRYSHILDPRTGYPVVNMASVTVICPDAELADALATAVSVMGVAEGLDLLEQLRGVEGIILTGAGTIHRTRGIPSLMPSTPARR